MVFGEGEPQSDLFKFCLPFFSSVVCRTRNGRSFLSLSVLFMNHVLPSLSPPSPCRSAVSPIPFCRGFSCAALLTIFPLPPFPSSLSIRPICQAAELPSAMPLPLGRVYGNIDFTVCMRCKKNQYFSRLSRVCGRVMEPSPLMLTCRGPHAQIEVSWKMETCFLILLSASDLMWVFMFWCLTYSRARSCFKVISNRMSYTAGNVHRKPRLGPTIRVLQLSKAPLPFAHQTSINICEEK